MRVESLSPADPTKERVEIVPDSTEDLWHLQYVIESGDLLAAETDRRIQRDDDRLRDTGGQRESIHVTLRVDSVEFHRFSDRLRVGGEIVEASREDQLGHHHTINLEVHDAFELEKTFKSDQWERLEEAQSATGDPAVVVVTIEEGRADFFDVEAHGPEHRTTIVTGSGKRSGTSERAALYDEIASILSRDDSDAVVLAGPGFVKGDVKSVLLERDPDLGDSIRTVDTSSIGERGVQEVVQRGVIDDVRTETRLAREADLIDELKTRLRETPGLVTYGPMEVARASELGAVETVCVVDDRLRIERSPEGEWDIDIDAVIERVEQQGGTVRVFSAEGEPGRELDGLGGIAALLRYQLD